jgi:Fur family transcriptional regulator, iron response regulator
MTTSRVVALLKRHHVQVTPQRMFIAEAALWSKTHPTADEIWTTVKRKHPTVSRATVYNTLNLLVDKHLLQTHMLADGITVFDPKTMLHHHFIDEETGEVHDIPWEAIQVRGKDTLPGFDVREFQVVMRGRKRKR